MMQAALHSTHTLSLSSLSQNEQVSHWPQQESDQLRENSAFKHAVISRNAQQMGFQKEEKEEEFFSPRSQAEGVESKGSFAGVSGFSRQILSGMMWCGMTEEGGDAIACHQAVEGY